MFAISSLTVKRPWMKVQEPLDMCDEKSLPNVRSLLKVISVLPISVAEAGQVFFKVEGTLIY